MSKTIQPGVASFLSLVKFSHTIFALPFAVIGFMLGAAAIHYHFHWETAVLVLLCMVFVRNAAMSFNRWADRDIDALNPRTRMREIPAGIIKANQALWFTILNSLLFITCTCFINRACLILAPVALLVTLGYSYTKRFTALCHLVLGLGLSLAPIGSYLALTGHFSTAPVCISLAVLCWVSGFDIIYALQDEEFDKSQKLHSIPALLGKEKALQLSTLLHFLASVFLLGAGYAAHLAIIYFTGWLVFTGLLVYQHLLVKPNDLKRVNVAFFTTNGIASVLFCLFTVADILYFS
jgi:4-hydroxybenzoate polyprenyltransferase